MLPLAHGSLHDAHENDNAAIGVEPRVEDEGLKGRIGIAFGGGETMHDRFQHFVHSLACFGAHGDGVRSIQSDGLLDVFLGAENVGGRQVDLVDHRNDFQTVMDSQIGVGERLRLDALARVDHQQGTLARGQRTRDLIAEVHVARRINQIELVDVAVARLVHHAHSMGFDGDATLPLEVHVVEDLGLHLAIGHRSGQFQQPVAESRLAVVDVRDDGEVAKETGVHGRAFRGFVQGVLEPVSQGIVVDSLAPWDPPCCWVPSVPISQQGHL